MPDRSCKSFKIAISTFLETFKPEVCQIYCDKESSFLNLNRQMEKTGNLSKNSKKMNNSGKNENQSFLSSPEFREISQRFKIKFKFTTGRDPLQNGYIEVLNKSLKYSFSGFLHNKSDLFEYKLTILQIQQALNNRPLGFFTNKTTKLVEKITPFSLVYGRPSGGISIYGEIKTSRETVSSSSLSGREMIDQSLKIKKNFTYLWNRLVESQFKLVQGHWNSSILPPNYPRKGELCLYFPQRYSKHPGSSKLYFVALVTEVHFGRTIPDYKTGNKYLTLRHMNTSNDFPTSVSLQYVHKNTIKTCKKPIRFLQPLDLYNWGSENQGNGNGKAKTLIPTKKTKQGLMGTPQNPLEDIREVVGMEPE